MKKNILLIILLLNLITLSSCAKTTINNKIIYNTNKIEYTTSTREYSSSIFYNLIYQTNPNIFKGQNSKYLSKISNKITELLLNFDINENDYVELLDFIKDNTYELANIYKNNDYENDIFNEFTSRFLLLFGLNNIITFIYDFTLFYYDYKIEDYESNKKNNPLLNTYYTNLITEKENDRDIFNNIDKIEFNHLLKSTYLILKLLKSNYIDSVDSLSNEEILLFINKFDLSVDLSSEEYQVLFKLLREIGLNKELFNKVLIADNIIDITNTINNILNLFDSVISKINENVIIDLKNNDTNLLIKDILLMFDENDKELFNNIFSLKLDETYLEYFSDILDLNKLESLDNLDSNEIFNMLDDDNNVDNLYRVIRKVFYD